MNEQTFSFEPSVVGRFDAILSRGLCAGSGDPNGQMCVEQAISLALGKPFSDDPSDCVDVGPRRFSICLNDSGLWPSPEARAAGMRDLGIAQIGSKGVVDEAAFADRLAEKTIRVLIPSLFREIFPASPECLAAADRCEREGSAGAAAMAAEAAEAAAWAVEAAWPWAAKAAAAKAAKAWAAKAAAAAEVAAARSARPGRYLALSAQLAVEVLRELRSPGCAFL